MTGPRYTYDPSQYQVGSDSYNQQLTQFNALRDAYVQQMLQRVGGSPPQQTAAMVQQGPPASQDWRDDDLLGAAKFWGIPDEVATQIPRDQLIGMLNDLRTKARPSDAQSLSLVNAGAAFSAFGVGAGEAVVRGLRNLPLVGETLGRIGALHSADIYLQSLEEGVRSSTPTSIQPVLSGEKWTGNIAALAYPANVAWNAAGKLGASIPFLRGAKGLSAIVRGAAAGAGSAWALEGGSPEFEDNKALILGSGAVLGAAPEAAMSTGRAIRSAWQRFRPVSAAAANKVTAAFVPTENAPPGFEASGTTTTTAQPGTTTTARPEGFEPSLPAESIPLTEAPLPRGFEARPSVQDMSYGQFPEGASAQGERIPAPPIASFARFDPLAREWEGIRQTTRRPQGFTPTEAVQNATSLNKAATILESPDLPNAVASPKIDETTVGRAAISSNPGGSNIVQGVGDPVGFAQQVPADHLRFATAPGTERIDAIISDTPVTERMVAQYEVHGVYETQHVTLPSGLSGTIEGISEGHAMIKIAGTTRSFTSVPLTDLQPSVQSPGSAPVEKLWQDFQRFAGSKAEAASTELSGRVVPEQLPTILQQNLPTYMDDFLEGVEGSVGFKARVRSFINDRYVESYKALAPAESMQMESAISSAIEAPDPGTSPLGALDRRAASRGFIVLPREGAGVDVIAHDVGTTVEGQPPAVMHFDSFDSAHDWLRALDRELPDITPPSSIPGDLIGMHITAPTQAPNLNPSMEPAIVRELDHLASNPEDMHLGMLAAQAKSLAGTGQLSKLEGLYQNAFMNVSSMRKLFAGVDQFAYEGGLYERGLTPFKDYEALSTAINAHQNMMEPMQEAAHQVIQDIRVANRRSGLWSQMYMIQDPAERAAQAAAHGLNPAEIGAFDKLSAVWHDFFGQTGLSPERELRQYLPMIQRMQSTGDFSLMQNIQVSPESEAFMLYVRNGVVNSRELDPEVLLSTYIRTLSWNKNVEPVYSDIAKRWNTIQNQVPELSSASDIMQNWLRTIKYGYQPGQNDTLLDWAQVATHALLGPGVSRQQTRQLVNFGLNNTYSALMGYRLDLAARDLQQIWLALPRAGGKLLSVMGRYMTGGGKLQADMWDQAIADRMISLQHPRALAPGATRPLEQAAFDPSEIAAKPPSARLQALGKISAAIEDMTPNVLKSTKLRPGYIYGKQGEIVRMLVGAAGKETATDALIAFRSGDAAGDMAKLLNDSRANTFYPAVTREFQRLVSTGADQEAATFLGRQLADASQFKYGPAAAPINYRTLTGRLWSQLGSYPLYYTEYLNEVFRYGTTASKVATAATIGTVAAAFHAASKATGWNFYRMNPFTGINFVAGGPFIEQIQNVAKAASGTADALTGQTRGGTGGGAPPDLLGALGNAAQLFNPAGGLIRTVGGIGQALDSPYPGQTLAKLAITGERGAQQEIGESLMPQAQQGFQQSLQPVPSAVRSGQAGIPGQAPPQLVTMPPELGGGTTATSGYSVPPTAGGAPGYPGPVAATNDSTRLLTQRQHYDSAAAQLRQSRMPESAITSILGSRP